MKQLERNILQTCLCPWQKFLVAEVLGGSSLQDVSCKFCRRAFAGSSLIGKLCRHVHVRGTFLVAEVLGGRSLQEVSCKFCRRAFP